MGFGGIMAKTFSSSDLGFDSPKKKTFTSEDLGFDDSSSKEKSSGFDPATALRGLGEAGTLGHLSNAQSATEPLMFKALNVITGKNVETDDVFDKEAYIKRRDERVSELEKMKDENPGSYYTGLGAGSLLTSAVPGLSVGKGLKGLSAMKAAAKIGAIQGLLANPGEEKGEITIKPVERGIGGVVGGLTSGLLQGAGELAGAGLDKTTEFAKQLFKKAKPNAEEIQAAAKVLGSEATPGMLAEGGFVPRLEESLANSPSMFGRKIAERRGDVFKKAGETAEGLLSEASNLTPFQQGEQFKKGMVQEIGKKQGPISMVYDEIKESTGNIPIAEKSKAIVLKNIEKIPGFSVFGKSGAPSKYMEMLDSAKTATDMSDILSLMKSDVRSGSVDGAERKILSQMIDKFGRLEQSSILRGSVESARNSGEGESVARELIGDIKGARKGYRGLMSDISSVADDAGIKSYTGPGGFLDKVESVPSEVISQKFFNPKNLRGIENLKSKFPEQYELLRTGKIKEVLEKSIGKAGNETDVMAGKFLKELSKMNPEIEQLLFPQGGKELGALRTVLQNVPEKFNNSGTAGSSKFSTEAIMSNLYDIPQYMLYNFANTDSADKLAKQLMNKSPALAELSRSSPKAFNSFMMNLLQNANKDSNNKSQGF